MASPSIKKTWRALRGKEGIYASEYPAGCKNFSDLGLTLLPGSQILKGEKENVTDIESRKLDLCFERCRRQREKVEASIDDGDEPTAQGISSPVGNGYEPLYPQAVISDPHASLSPEPLHSTFERGNPMCGSESVANLNFAGCSDISHAQNPSSFSKFAVVSEDGIRCHESGEIGDRHGSGDPHDLDYRRKKRRVEHDGNPRPRSESFTTMVPSVFQGAGQPGHFKFSQPKMCSRNVPSRKYTPDLGHASSQAPYPRRVERSQCTSRAGNVSTEAFSSCQFTRDSSWEDSYAATNAAVSQGRSSKLDILETPHQISLLRRGDGGELCQREGVDSSPPAEHWTHAKPLSLQSTKHRSTLGILHSLGTGLVTLSSRVEAAARADEMVVGVEPDVSSNLVSPLSPTLPSWEIYASKKHPDNLDVHQSNKSLQYFAHQHFNFTYPVSSNFYNHPSYISTLSSKNTTLRSYKSKFTLQNFIDTASPYSIELRTRRHSSASLLRQPPSLATDIATIKPRPRSNSLSELTAIFPKRAMNNSTTSQPFRFTEEQVNNQIQQTYDRQQPISSFQLPSQAQTHLHGATIQHPCANGINHAVDGAPHHRVTMDQQTSHLAFVLTLHLLKMDNQSAESPGPIASYLKAFVVKLSEFSEKRNHLHRTLGFLNSFPVAGSPPDAVPLDVDLLRLRKQATRLEAQITTIENQKNQTLVQKNQLLAQNQQQHNALMVNSQTIAQQQDLNARQAADIERLRRDALQWKEQAEKFHRLLTNPPPRALSSNTLYERISHGSTPVGGSMLSSEPRKLATNTPSGSQMVFHAGAPQEPSMQAAAAPNDKLEMDRRDSTFSSASSDLVDLTAEYSTPATSAPSHLSSPMSRQSLDDQRKATPGQMFSAGSRKPAWVVSNLPAQHPLNLALYGQEKRAQDVIDVDAVQRPFAFEPSDEMLDAAEARKSNPSYASYQQKSRVTKNTKAPKLTKAQLQEHENEHAPPPKKSKKVKKTRVWKPRETPEEKVARLADEQKMTERDAVIQEELFQQSTMERQDREHAEHEMAGVQAMLDTQEQRQAEEKEAEKIAEMEAELDATMPDLGDETEEPTIEVNEEQVVQETAPEILHGSAQDTTNAHTIDSVQESNTSEAEEQAAIAAEDDGLGDLFDDDEATNNFQAAATALLGPAEQSEAIQDPNDIDFMLSTPHPTEDLGMFMDGSTYDLNDQPIDPNDPIFAEDFWEHFGTE